MNEKLRQLALQAVKAVDNPFPGNLLNDELAKMYIPDCFAEKFAELIIRDSIEMFACVDYDESVDMLMEHWDIDPRIFRS
jgi:hypothetical protein